MGPLGAGKGTVAEYLHKKHNFIYLSMRNFIAEEVLKRGLLVNPQTIVKVAAEVRAEHGGHYVLEQLLTRAASGRKVVIESIRTENEVQALKAKGGVLWALEADAQTRYARTAGRAFEHDRISFAEFEAKDKADIAELAAIRALADVAIENIGSRPELEQKVDKEVLELQKKLQPKVG